MEGSYGTTVTGSSTNKQKVVKRHRTNEREACIWSKLPEPLISHILSFLPTKDAVRTSVLSKKWLFLWTLITKLDLDDTVFYSPKRKTGGKMHFLNFVYRVLLLTKSSTLESFSLVIANKYDVSLLNTWISNILIRKVKNLSIDTHFEMPFSTLAAHSLFNCKFLEELVLKMNSCAIRVAGNYVHFEHLKLLKLSGISFTLDSKFPILSLPVLKLFETMNCTWLNAKCLTLKVPELESVVIVQDAKPRSYETPHCAIEFSALNLKEFSYRGCGYISHYFKLMNPSLAHGASLNVTVNQCPINRDPETECRAYILLKQFSEVKYLKFEGCEVLPQSRVAKLPLFGMLSQLDLGSISGEVLLELLLKSPFLKTLVFKGVSKFNIELLNSAAVPDCLVSTLQVVKFHQLHASEHELCLAKFFMENGLVLERMSFFLVNHQLGKSKVMEEFKEKLFSFKKGFALAIIEFSYDD